MLRLERITPTVFLRERTEGLEQRVTLTVRNPGGGVAVEAVVESPAGRIASRSVRIPEGETDVDVFIPELSEATELRFVLRSGGREADSRRLTCQPPRRWSVHVVQLSHHDVGYTNLASTVLEEHDRWLDSVIDMAEATDDYPEPARFRMVVEQAWSIDHFLKNAPPERAGRMIELMREGRVELTALFGNMITELCGHETLVRCTYPAARIAREHGIPIVSAEHNDVPGFARGLAQVLTESGVRIFCPGLPNYYGWGDGDLPSFWDQEAIFGYEAMPGAFWWEAPDRGRVLFWCNNSGCGGDCRGGLPGLAGRLGQLERDGYPYPVLRWPVSGGARDNSPYIRDYADTIREWNERWAYPRLVCSTNARFYEEFVRRVDTSDLPVHRGDVPGQDYPVGATSTAGPTAVNRRNHRDLPAAEALATTASLHVSHRYPTEELRRATREILWYDEHTWGHHFPAGPTAKAAEHEKALHAHRAAALAHDVAEKAKARLADRIRLEEPGLHLVVFNPTPRERSGYVTASLRELDNCGSEMVPVLAADDPRGQGYLRGVLLNDRWHVNPPPEIVSGQFELVDVETGESVPHEIRELDSPPAPEPYAAQRLGLGQGGHRYGLFEDPGGIRRDLLFHAGPLPALGYRTYRLVPGDAEGDPCAGVAGERSLTDAVIENDHYRLDVNPYTGRLRSLIDRNTGREWVDAEGDHPFGGVIVRRPSGEEIVAVCEGWCDVETGPLSGSVRAVLSAPGHPRMELTYGLRAGERRVRITLAMQMGPEPLLETFLAFPFALPEAEWTAETPLCAYRPVPDRLPGAFANRLTVQDWVRLSDGEASLLWSSLNTPVISPARLWPSRVSPAHSCVTPPGLDRPPQDPADLRGGAIYSLLTANDFGTNFAVSQEGTLVFRYELTTRPGEASVEEAASFARRATRPMQTIFTQHPGDRTLPPAGEFLRIDNPAVELLALKRAEVGEGIILRLWNPTASAQETAVRLPQVRIRTVKKADLTEEPVGGAIPTEADGFVTELRPRAVATLRVVASA